MVSWPRHWGFNPIFTRSCHSKWFRLSKMGIKERRKRKPYLWAWGWHWPSMGTWAHRNLALTILAAALFPTVNVRAFQDLGQPVRGATAWPQSQRASSTSELSLALDAPPEEPLLGRKSDHQGPERQLRGSGETWGARHHGYPCFDLSSKFLLKRLSHILSGQAFG